MWCYQKPGFEALLLAELQRQQQCSQFCDTLLKAEGVSVPAHSCVLSAISPHVSSALSSAPPPPAGQGRLLEFQAHGPCTLLHMVTLLYSGEMAGEGEKQKQEALSAAGNLGIHGLVEVTARKWKSRNEGGGGRHTEVGVQTEPLMFEAIEGRRSRWRKEVRDGSMFLWKETMSEGEKDMGTQTYELQVNSAPPTHSTASFQTIDMAALQDSGNTDSHLVPAQIPYIPVSLVYPPENQAHQPSSAPVLSMQNSAAAERTSVAVVIPPYTCAPTTLQPLPILCTPNAKNWGIAPQGVAREVVAGEEWHEESFEHFQGNIPEFINHFLNPIKQEGPRRGRARRRQGAGMGNARRAGTSERRSRRPRGTAGRKGGFMQTVDVQEVGVSRQRKLIQQRRGRRTSRPGQGGGAVGRKLYLKTREVLKKEESSQRRRGRRTLWELSQRGELHSKEDGGARRGRGGGPAQRRSRGTTQQQKQESLPVRRSQRARAKSTTSVSPSSTPMQLRNIHTSSRPSQQPSPSSVLQSPAASFMPPASSLLHTTSLPPLSPSPHDDQPEHIDRLLEEVMMGLDILPNSSGAPDSRCPPPVRSIVIPSCGNDIAPNKQQNFTHGLLEGGPGSDGSGQHVSAGRGARGSPSARGEVPVFEEQRGEGELNKILDHFLQSFEQHIDNCHAVDTEGMEGESFAESSEPCTVLNKHKKKQTQTATLHSSGVQNAHAAHAAVSSQIIESQQSDGAKTPPLHLQGNMVSAPRVPPEQAGETPVKVTAPGKPPNKRVKKKHLFSLDRRSKRVKKPVSMGDTKTETLYDLRDKQLKQMPVVKLERSGLMRVSVAAQAHRCESREAKGPATVRSSSDKYPCCGSSSEKDVTVLWGGESYPIRSRFKGANIPKSQPFLDKIERRPRKNIQLLSLPSSESSSSEIQPAEPRGANERENDQEQEVEVELTGEPQREAEDPTRRRKRRRAESGEETSDGATVEKRVCSELMARPTSGTFMHCSSCADIVSKPANTEADEVIDVEAVWLATVGGRSETEGKCRFRETEQRLMGEKTESSEGIIDVEGDSDGDL